jgi:hypothetical protein
MDHTPPTRQHRPAPLRFLCRKPDAASVAYCDRGNRLADRKQGPLPFGAKILTQFVEPEPRFNVCGGAGSVAYMHVDS